MSTTRAVQIDRAGGPEELKIVEAEVGDPGPGEIRIRHRAVGLNFIDAYQRKGTYPMQLPAALGGEGVEDLEVGVGLGPEDQVGSGLDVAGDRERVLHGRLVHLVRPGPGLLAGRRLVQQAEEEGGRLPW